MNVEYREGNEFERKGNDKVSGMHEKRERSTGVGNGNLLLHPIPRIRIVWRAISRKFSSEIRISLICSIFL